MIRTRWQVIVPVLGLLATCAGCGSPPCFQIETVVHPDGSCDRKICQPKGEMLPEDALKPVWNARWKKVDPDAAPPAFALKKAQANEYKYFSASGTFPGPREIPDHFRHFHERCPEVGTSELVRSYERRDCGFVVEHRWSETLTNIVTRAGFLKARDEFLDLAMPFAALGIERVYGDAFDVKGLLRYLRTEGRRFLEQAAVVLYDVTAAHAPEDEQSSRLAKVAQQFGLDMFDANGDLVSVEEGQARLETLLRHRIMLGVRHHDGSRLTEAEVRSLIPKDSASPYSQAWEKFCKEHEQALEAQLAPHIFRMTGLYGYPFGLGVSPEFEFALRLPGEFVETNGKVDIFGQARWQFAGARSFPDGFTMRARSVEMDAEGQKWVFGRVVISDRAGAEAFLKVLGEDGPLLEAVRKVRQTGDPAPLRDFQPKTDERRDRAARLRELLKLPG
jgi:hypothetical protein